MRVKTKAKKVTMMRSDESTQTAPGKPLAAFNVIADDKYHYITKLSEYTKDVLFGGVGIIK